MIKWAKLSANPKISGKHLLPLHEIRQKNTLLLIGLIKLQLKESNFDLDS